MKSWLTVRGERDPSEARAFLLLPSAFVYA